jgi:hypothetical protein
MSFNNLVLHPSFKDEYFKLAKWPKDWIGEAINLTWDMYEAWYKPRQPTSAPKNPRTVPPKVSWHKLTLPKAHFQWDLTLPLLTIYATYQPQTGLLAGLGAAALARSVEAMSDPIDIWLSGGLVLEDGAPVNGLKWWADQKSGGNTHNGLMQMALDVMACPGE